MAVLTCTHNLCVEQQEEYQNFSHENFQVLKLKESLFIAWASLRNACFFLKTIERSDFN